MVKPVRKNSNKNPPILSHEFIIQNHADIVSCVAMVFVIGLMIQVSRFFIQKIGEKRSHMLLQATSPLASVFIALQHNVTEAGEIPLYSPGLKDWAAVFFYSLICIVIHAIIQEYGLDVRLTLLISIFITKFNFQKISKKLHLSKSKLAVFSTSGQLTVFYLISAFWGADIALKERYLPEIARLWSDYPASMPFLVKLYIIIQLAYSLHELPELYFQRVKREEYSAKAVQSIVTLILVAIPYFLK